MCRYVASINSPYSHTNNNVSAVGAGSPRPFYIFIYKKFCWVTLPSTQPTIICMILYMISLLNEQAKEVSPKIPQAATRSKI
jgi:hypothetical protein